MQGLVNREIYGPELALTIETMGSITVGVANRWQMGWPDRVAHLLKAGGYQKALEEQVNQEKDVLAEAVEMRHLARHEILKMHEIQEAPPTMD